MTRKKQTKIFLRKDISMFIRVVLGTLIYCFGIVFLLDLGKFYAGGITGIAQLLTELFKKIDIDFVGFKSIFIAALNIPLFLIARKGVSKRFAVSSLISVLLQVGFIAFFEYLQHKGINPFEEFEGDMLCLAIIGGFLTGIGCGICLKCGASTGGMDVITQYVSLNKRLSFPKVSFLIDLAIIICSAFVGSIPIAVYTVIRMIIGTVVLDKIYTAYNYTKITIVTEEREAVRDAILSHFNHGLTVLPAFGAYTNRPKYIFEAIVWSFETNEYLRVVKKVDPKCFVSTVGVKQVEGPFRINVIA